jgi:hypothetical protein
MISADEAIASAIRSGGLFRYRAILDPGELDVRMLWIRPEIRSLLSSAILEAEQREQVKALFKRFVVGRKLNVVTAKCAHREVDKLGDIKELKTKPPPFIEVRFKPPKHDLRIFGRFIGKDKLVLTTHGMKSLEAKTGTKRLSVADERRRCDSCLQALRIDPTQVPNRIEDSLSNATFI